MIYRLKYPLVFVLLMATGLAGCIKEREIETPGGKVRPVVFAPQVSRGGESRAATGHPIENGATIPVGDYHFGVYAWVKPTSGAPVEPFAELHNAKVRHASTAEYTYDPVASWPRDADAKLACMAYYPWSDQTGNIRVTTGTGTNQTLTINYTVPASSADHVDLMYAKTGLTPGYDPVNLDFHHALARLKFEGRTEDFPAGSAVKITGIRITNAVMKGDLVVLDPTVQTGKPPWTLSTAPADKGTITMPATHVKDLVLTSTLQSVITPGGDMLVIPQTVDGLTVEVSASLNGTAFPEPFVFSLTSSPEWTMNEIITYEITLMPDGMHLTANVTDWTTDPVNVIHDGQYYLDLSHDRLDLAKEGGAITLEIKTNYNKTNAASDAAGSYIDATGIDNWATVTDLGQTQSGSEYTRTVRISAASFESATDRTPTSFKVKAGNMTYIFHLTQSKDSYYWFKITDGSGTEVDELVFDYYPAASEVPAQTLKVEWNIPDNCTITEIATGTSGFIYSENSSRPAGSGTASVSGGIMLYSIQPEKVEQSELNTMPPVRSSNLTFRAVDEYGNVFEKTISIRQGAYFFTIVTNPASNYILDGQTESFQISTNANWTASFTGAAIFSGTTNRTGEPGMNQVFQYTFINYATAPSESNTAYVTFQSPDGKFTQQSVTIVGQKPYLRLNSYVYDVLGNLAATGNFAITTNISPLNVTYSGPAVSSASISGNTLTIYVVPATTSALSGSVTVSTGGPYNLTATVNVNRPERKILSDVYSATAVSVVNNYASCPYGSHLPQNTTEAKQVAASGVNGGWMTWVNAPGNIAGGGWWYNVVFSDGNVEPGWADAQQSIQYRCVYDQ